MYLRAEVTVQKCSSSSEDSAAERYLVDAECGGGVGAPVRWILEVSSFFREMCRSREEYCTIIQAGRYHCLENGGIMFLSWLL